ncbi:MAG: lysophospholipid acyltransferase family protein [Bryobacterales bacterium]|nr:lysophospholipid acyltransferase family protein [Bryobacterales bacterium]
MAALHRNEAVGILIDQTVTPDRGIFIDFFGRPACVDSAFARLAARTGAAVIPGYALWSDEESRYILHFDPPVPITGDVQADTQAIHARLESAIRRHPAQWLWIHRRWKTRPPGEPPLYLPKLGSPTQPNPTNPPPPTQPSPSNPSWGGRPRPRGSPWTRRPPRA